MTDSIFLGHADTAMHLHGALRHVPSRLPDADLRQCDIVRSLIIVRIVDRHGRQHRHAAALLLHHEHVGQPVLHHLIRTDRVAKLDPGLAVLQRHLIHRLHRADGFPRGRRDTGFDHALDHRQAAADLAQHIGVRDRNVGQGDIRRYHQIIARLGDRLHWIGGIGDDCVPGYYSIGIRVFTSSIATVTPKIPLLLDAAASAGDQKELDRLMREYVIPLYALRARRKGYEVTVMKQMMDFAGLAGGPVRPPLPKLRPAEIEEVRAMVERWKPMPAK